MSITVTQHKLDLHKKIYIVTIKDGDKTIVDKKNIGCPLTASGEFNESESIQRIKTIVASFRAGEPTANVWVDME